jgi:hypothetical protein
LSRRAGLDGVKRTILTLSGIELGPSSLKPVAIATDVSEQYVASTSEMKNKSRNLAYSSALKMGRYLPPKRL